MPQRTMEWGVEAAHSGLCVERVSIEPGAGSHDVGDLGDLRRCPPHLEARAVRRGLDQGRARVQVCVRGVEADEREDVAQAVLRAGDEPFMPDRKRLVAFEARQDLGYLPRAYTQAVEEPRRHVGPATLREPQIPERNTGDTRPPCLPARADTM